MLLDSCAGERFDIVFDGRTRGARQNCTLILHVDLYFEPVAAREGRSLLDPGRGRLRAEDWTEGEFRKWTDCFVRESRNLLNGLFWLITPPSYRGLDWPCADAATHRPNIFCSFDVGRVNDPNRAHHRLRCLRLRDDEASGFRLEPRGLKACGANGLGKPSGETLLRAVERLLCLPAPDLRLGLREATAEAETLTCWGRVPGEAADLPGVEVPEGHAGLWQQAVARLTGVGARRWRVSRTFAPPVELRPWWGISLPLARQLLASA